MKKLCNTAFFYAILAMAGGVFYREFTKFNAFTGKTTLSVVHTHLFMLGMVFFLVLLSLEKTFELTAQKRFNRFYYIYNAGVLLAVVMLVVRGILQTLSVQLSGGLDAAISGIAGLGHIVMGVGIILLFLLLKKQIAKKTHPAHPAKK